MRRLEDDNKLNMIYTQNIDGLERVAGISDKFVDYLHGTVLQAWCTSNYEDHKLNLKTYRDEIKKRLNPEAPNLTCLVCEKNKQKNPEVVKN